jgi:hypothetical protein
VYSYVTDICLTQFPIKLKVRRTTFCFLKNYNENLRNDDHPLSNGTDSGVTVLKNCAQHVFFNNATCNWSLSPATCCYHPSGSLLPIDYRTFIPTTKPPLWISLLTDTLHFASSLIALTTD